MMLLTFIYLNIIILSSFCCRTLFGGNICGGDNSTDNTMMNDSDIIHMEEEEEETGVDPVVHAVAVEGKHLSGDNNNQNNHSHNF